jgi:hypothetical protein
MKFHHSWRLLLTFSVVVATGYAFLAGPLFAWSPFKPGYNMVHFERADVYFGSGSSLDPSLANVDRYIARTEDFHQLKFGRRMAIIICRSWSDFHRFLPTVRGDGVGAATPEFGTVIYVTPKVRELGRDPGEYVRHELSHAVLDQNSTLWRSLHFKQAPWFVEGLAVLAAEQKSYGTWDDFVARARKENLAPLFFSAPAQTPGFDIRFAYLAWRYFLAWMIDTQGRANFQHFTIGFLQRPTEAPPLFYETYNEDLQAAVFRFEAAVRDGTWHEEAASQSMPR